MLGEHVKVSFIGPEHDVPGVFGTSSALEDLFLSLIQFHFLTIFGRLDLTDPFRDLGRKVFSYLVGRRVIVRGLDSLEFFGLTLDDFGAGIKRLFNGWSAIL